jgi:hypothetical protein
MRTGILAAALAFLPAGLYAQAAAPVSSSVASKSSTQDAPADPATAVSLDRIREGLTRTTPLQETLEKQPTFRVDVQEKNPFDQLLDSLDLKHYPPVPGGLYALEQQRVGSNPVDHPLEQPYAAFSGPELITIAVENLVAKYLGRMVGGAISSADRAHAESAARAEVSEAVARYCAALPAHGAGESLCNARVTP